MPAAASSVSCYRAFREQRAIERLKRYMNGYTTTYMTFLVFTPTYTLVVGQCDQLLIAVGPACRKGERKEAQIVSSIEISNSMNSLMKKLYSIGGNKMVGVACLAIVRVILMNYQGRLQGQLFETAFLKRVPEFFRILVRNVGICIASSAVESTRQYLLDSLAIQWRGWVTELLHAKYFSRMVRPSS